MLQHEPKVEKHVKTMTGKTAGEMPGALEEGLSEPKERYCYLCKRKEGDPAAYLNTVNDGKTEICYRPVSLHTYEFDMFRNSLRHLRVIAKYFLCGDCIVLLENADVLIQEFSEHHQHRMEDTNPDMLNS
jgi:hypothetical protein